MDANLRRFIKRFALFVGVLCFAPYILAMLVAPRNAQFIGSTYNLDDQMVYAAWMRQAMDGAFIFDSRFTVEPQAGLTINLYFLLLGWIAKLIGIPLAMCLSKGVLAWAFVMLTGKLSWRLTGDAMKTKLATALAVFGGGIGFVVWHSYGLTIVRTTPPFLSSLLHGLLPIDVWQPEALAFPSLLTNTLFAASLCLIIGILYCFLAARDGWHAVPYGALGMLVLMNIHSYDVLIIGIAMVGLLVMSVASKTITGAWLVRCLTIVAGAIPSALWFVHVYTSDPIFAARANVATYAPSFSQIWFGLVLLILGAIAAFMLGRERTQRQRLGAAAILFLAMGLTFASPTQVTGYWLGWGLWLLLFVVCLGILALLADSNTTQNLLWSWAVLGVIAPYIPVPFQRKFAMGMAIPWAILCALGLATLIQKTKPAERVLVGTLCLLVVSWTSIRWFFRDIIVYEMGNVSNTTLHQPFLHRDVVQIINILNKERGKRTVVLAMPGLPEPHDTEPDRYKTPYLPDLNPILSGLTGVYTVAGHWGETPDYGRTRALATLFFLRSRSDQDRMKAIQDWGVDYIVAPVPLAFPEVEVIANDTSLVDLEGFGDVVYPGDRFMLIRVRK